MNLYTKKLARPRQKLRIRITGTKMQIRGCVFDAYISSEIDISMHLCLFHSTNQSHEYGIFK
jgi:hypothetical protein